MKIIDVVCSAGRTGFFFDDQRAIKKGARQDGAAYLGAPETPGFSSVRQAGESISVMLLLDDGQVAWGDCAAVQYSGAGGRDPLFLAETFIPLIERRIKPWLVGKSPESFRALCAELEEMEAEGRSLHTAIRYGVSQAILDATARARRAMMCEVVAQEYGTTLCDRPIPIFAQTGDARYENADKIIMKGAQALPHGLINHVGTKLGEDGELLRAYIAWLRDRIIALRADESYSPTLHLDVYGNIAIAFGGDYERMADYMASLGKTAAPFALRIEGPIDAEERGRQIDALAELTRMMEARGSAVEIVADEWCNTLEDIKLFADARAGHMAQIKTPDLGGIGNIAEAVLYCKEKGMGAYQGGTCNETDRSAQACVHVAMATGPCQILAKPGMGVDEGMMIVHNEMQRILALAKARRAP